MLVADDEPDMLRFLKSQLAPTYQVIEAVDGQQAMEKASQFLPDIILLDMMMPEKDGLQACREIRGNVPTQNIPVVLLTARADEETKLAALEVGASDFLAKPFSTTELHVRIRNLVESHHYQRKLSKQNQVLESTIEQLKETETQLVQSEKLASLGRMSAGIIHEINNPLNFATTGLFALRARANAWRPTSRVNTRRSSRTSKRASSAFNASCPTCACSRIRTRSRDQVEVAEVVGGLAAVLEQRMEGQGADRAEAGRRPDHLGQPQQADPRAGQSAAEFAGCARAQGLCGRSGRPSGSKAAWTGDRSLLVIRDNGAGIDTEHLDKIFDPFFTTKDVGKGMGLGLSICYRIVQEYDGRISVRTEPGRFCEFTLEFPATGAANRIKGDQNMENLYDYRKFAVLYVDDEEMSLVNFSRALSATSSAS